MTELTEAQQALLAARLAQKPASRTPASRAAEAIPGVDDAPLSPGQEALWFERQRDEESARYSVTTQFIVAGEVDPDRFGRALRRVAANHEPLHTSFDEDRSIISVDRAIEITVSRGDVASLEKRAVQQSRMVLDPLVGPLIRVQLVDLTDGRWGVAMTLHHLWCDADSISRLFGEIDTVYQGKELTEPAATYSAHAAWQRRRVSEEQIVAATQSCMPGVTPDLGLATPEPAAGGGYVERPLDTDLGRHRPLAAAIAGLAVLVAGQTDDPSLVGVAMSTRDHPAAHDLVGYFMNTVPAVLPNPTSKSFGQLLDDAADVMAGLLERRTVPYSSIVNRRRQADGISNLADLMLVVHADHQHSFNGHPVTSKTVPNGTAVAPLTFFLKDNHHLAAEFARDRYSQSDVEAMLERLQSILDDGFADPDQPAMALLDPFIEQTHHGHALPSCSASSVLELLAERAHQHPRATAVSMVASGSSITYERLLARADQVASTLAAKGVTAGNRVAVRLPRGIDQVISILGVLRAGAAYVPVDVSLPEQRVTQMIEGAKPAFVIEAGFEVDETPSAGAAALVGASQEAYVIFTSGSTGVPKGIAVRHRELLASTLARNPVYGSGPERFLWTSGFGFDSSMVGLFWTLCSGGELVIPRDETAGDPDALVEAIRVHRVTHLLTVPSLYGALLRRGGGRLESLRVAIVAGEACPAELVARHSRTLPMCALWNEYGPSEATVWATVHRCLPEDTEPVPIGATIPGASTRVTGEDFRRTKPAGVAGELMVGGPGVTTGYLGSDPTVGSGGRQVFVELEGTRWYRTGDRVRRLPDGTLTFLGRVDSQLNVNGVRLEPEGVEQLLARLDGVAASIVRSEPGPTGREQLVTHIEVASGSPLTEAQVRVHLSRALPAAAVPQRIHLHPKLPRNHNGKVDRTAAISIDNPDPALDEQAGHEASDSVRALVELWQRFSGRNDAGPNSDFFEIGGDSLGSIELAYAIEKHVGFEVPVASVLAYRTPQRFAAEHLRPPRPDDRPLGPWCSILRTSRGPDAPLFLFAPGDGRLTAYQPLLDQLKPDYPIFGFTLPGTDRRGSPFPTVQAHTDAFLNDVVEEGQGRPIRLLGMSTGGLLAYDMAQRLEEIGHAVEMVIMVDTIFPSSQNDADANVTHWAEPIRAASAHARVQLAVMRGGRPRPGLTDRAMRRATQRAVSCYHPVPIEAPVLFVAASSTSRSLTVDHWKPLIKNLTVEQLSGAHTGEGGLMKAGRVSSVAVAVDRNLS